MLLRLVGVVTLLAVSSLAWWLWERRDGYLQGATRAAPWHREHRVSSGLLGVELDAEAHHELTRRFGVLRTPTILLADHAGDVVGRISGAPTTAQALDALGAVAE